MASFANKRTVSIILKNELEKRGVELNTYEFACLLRYAKDNNRVGEKLYNVSYLDTTVTVWLQEWERKHKRL